MLALIVNGESRDIDVSDDMPLLWALRDKLDLNGAKYGCGVGLCGSCTVHVDGKAVRACQVSAASVAGQQITTIEGLDPGGEHRVQQAWRELNVPQCGYCQSGQIMQAAALLAENPQPSDSEILEAMSGNVCRCGCYQRIVDAVRLASTGI